MERAEQPGCLPSIHTATTYTSLYRLLQAVEGWGGGGEGGGSNPSSPPPVWQWWWWLGWWLVRDFYRWREPVFCSGYWSATIQISLCWQGLKCGLDLIMKILSGFMISITIVSDRGRLCWYLKSELSEGTDCSRGYKREQHILLAIRDVWCIPCVA